MRDDLQRTRIVITNFHAFQRRETMEAPKLAKAILGGRDGPVQTLETKGPMVQRVCGDPGGRCPAPPGNTALLVPLNAWSCLTLLQPG